MSGVAVVLLLLAVTLAPTTDASPLLSSLFPKMEVAPAIRGQDLKIGDGDVVDRKVYIYKCKICDMPRIFVMDYGSFIF